MNVIDRFDGTEYAFLSNFFPSKITIEGIEYPTVEHAFQAAKTFDKSKRLKIAKLPSPGQAKGAGRKLQMRPDWDSVRLSVMESCVREKFSTDPLKHKLLATGGAELIEGNHWNDRFWGVCSGIGENNLGKILMKVRNELIREMANSI